MTWPKLSGTAVKTINRIMESADPRAAHGSFLKAQFKRKFKKPITKEREAAQEEKRLARREQVAGVRAALVERCKGRCEITAGGIRFCAGPLEMDEFLGGWGRRRSQQTIEGAWMLCQHHHLLKTRNQWSVGLWNALFAEHCRRYGYPVLQRLDKHAAEGRP